MILIIFDRIVLLKCNYLYNEVSFSDKIVPRIIRLIMDEEFHFKIPYVSLLYRIAVYTFYM